MESNEQNKLMNKIETEAWNIWNRLTAVRGEWGETGWKKVKGLAKEHVCMTPRHRQWYDGQREGAGQEQIGEWANGGDGSICNSVNNKNKVRKPARIYYICCIYYHMV